jgi:archaellum component FlaF (FlaF/FlaG flagellin family)
VEKAITTVLLIIAGVVCMAFIFNSVYPMINRSSQAMTSMADQVDERMKSRISIVHAASSADRKTVYIWIKNVGTQTILEVKKSDLFFGQEDYFDRIPYVDDSENNPRWSFDVENADDWQPSATIAVTITYDSDPGTGTYYVKFFVPNGISDEYYFSM